MEKIQNVFAGLTGREKTGFLDTSQQSLYSKSRENVAKLSTTDAMGQLPQRQSRSIPFSGTSWLDEARTTTTTTNDALVLTETEHKTHFLTRAFGSPYYGCYALALTIFSIGVIRDSLYKSALEDQPFYQPLHQPALGAVLFLSGNVLVLTSMWALGVTGTYLGDYFGILMDEKVEGFPFNVTGAPMYWGSTLSFLGTALWYGRVAGLILTLEVFVMYLGALQFEDPFTAEIYAQKEARPVTRSLTKQKDRKKA